MGKITIIIESGDKTSDQLERWIKSVFRKVTPANVATYVANKED